MNTDEAPLIDDGSDPGLTARMLRRVETDFGDQASQAVEALGRVHSGNQNRERVLAAIVLSADGSMDRLNQLIELSHQDWRDVLVGGGLADEQWRTVLQRELGPSD